MEPPLKTIEKTPLRRNQPKKSSKEVLNYHLMRGHLWLMIHQQVKPLAKYLWLILLSPIKLPLKKFQRTLQLKRALWWKQTHSLHNMHNLLNLLLVWKLSVRRGGLLVTVNKLRLTVMRAVYLTVRMMIRIHQKSTLKKMMMMMVVLMMS